MAELVAGIGMSHSTLVVTDDGAAWAQHEAVDRKNPYLRDLSGREVTFEELESANGSRYASQASVEHLSLQAGATRRAVERLRADVTALAPDVLIVFGDDQMELHDLDHMPALGVFYGDQIVMGRSIRFATYEEDLGGVVDFKRAYAMDAHHVFPGHGAFARHLIASLMDDGFDVAAFAEVRDPAKAGVGHAFGIVETQLMSPGEIPLVPVFVNTYWAPNQLPVPRCWELGLGVRRAIDTFPAGLRIAVVASGGLSHFSTDEQLDARVLNACREGDGQALRELPPKLLNGGSSEIRNWIAVAAACSDKRVSWHEYIPVYRTAAGTGVGLAFMLWT